MIVNYSNLDVSKLESSYFLCGDEIALIDDTVETIKTYAKNNNYAINYLFIDTADDLLNLLADISQNSLFAQKSLKVINFHKMPQNFAKNLANMLNLANSENIFLMLNYNLRADKKRQKWFEILKADSVIVEHPTLKFDNLLNAIMLKMQNLGLPQDKSLATQISQMTEGNLLASYQELYKLALVFEEGNLSGVYFSQASKFSIFNLIDQVLVGDVSKTIKIYNANYYDMTFIHTFVRILQLKLKKFIQMSAMLEQNYAIYEVFRAHSVYSFEQNTSSLFLKRLSLKMLQYIMLKLGQIDSSLRGLGSVDYRYELLSLLIIMCNKRI